jgi:hypothetical protein
MARGKVKRKINSRFDAAFEELDQLGYFARQEHWCCQSCGCADVPNRFKNKFVFYHEQDLEFFEEGKPMYCSWGEGCDPEEVVRVFEKHGVNVLNKPLDLKSRILIS